MSKKKRKPKVMPITARDRMRITKTTVENPDWEPSKDGVSGIPRYEQREKNTRESAVEILYARKLLDSAQKKAADEFAKFYRAAGGQIASLDYSRDVVDGGKGDPVVSKLIAAQELKRCRDVLGRRGYEIVEAVCGEGKSLQEMTPHKRTRLTMADNLRADLDDLSVMWGMQTRKRTAA